MHALQQAIYYLFAAVPYMLLLLIALHSLLLDCWVVIVSACSGSLSYATGHFWHWLTAVLLILQPTIGYLEEPDIDAFQ